MPSDRRQVGVLLCNIGSRSTVEDFRGLSGHNIADGPAPLGHMELNRSYVKDVRRMWASFCHHQS